MKIFRLIWQDIRKGDNIDLYTTILFSIVLLVINLIGFATPSIIFSSILALIILTSISSIKIRHLLGNIEEHINNSGQGIIAVSNYPDDIKTNIEKANVFWIIGVSSLTKIEEVFTLLEQKLKLGHSVNVLLVNPESKAYEIATERDIIVDINYQLSRTNRTLKYLSTLQKIPENKLKVKLIDNNLDFEFIIADVETHQLIYMRHLGFRTPLGTEPILIIDSRKSEWFSYFTLHIQNLWNEARLWEINTG